MKKLLIVLLLMSACKEQSSYNGHEYVDLGLSVKWATCNVGARNPEDYGDYYAWGETSSKTICTWKNYRFRASGDSFSNIKFSKYGYDNIPGYIANKITLDLADDVANLKWGGNWRMPTNEEIDELYWNCDWTWTTLNGVSGVRITSKVEGYTDRSIFMPAAGLRSDKGVLYTGQYGHVWSSSTEPNTPRSYCAYFDEHGSYLDFTVRNFVGEHWSWYGTEDDALEDLPESLAEILRNYFVGKNVDEYNIPESIYNECRTYIRTSDWKAQVSYQRYWGFPIRAVCP